MNKSAIEITTAVSTAVAPRRFAARFVRMRMVPLRRQYAVQLGRFVSTWNGSSIKHAQKNVTWICVMFSRFRLVHRNESYGSVAVILNRSPFVPCQGWLGLDTGLPALSRNVNCTLLVSNA